MSSSNRIPWASIAGATISVAASYWMYQSVSEYGFEGTLRYIWEGDPYTPDIRNYIDSLEQAEKSRVTYGIRINAIEEALERARLDSVDDAKTSKEIVRLWVAYYAPQNLEKSLADLSHRLDRLAAQVDGITLGHFHSDSHTVKDLKRRKKLLSKQLVLHMERCDALLASYQVLGEEQ